MEITRREAIVGGAVLAAATATPAIARKPANILEEYDALGLASLVRKKQVSAKELGSGDCAHRSAQSPLQFHLPKSL